MSYVRRAEKAGSWYNQDGEVLNRQLTEWLAAVSDISPVSPRAIIAPHAGYSYSGPSAAFAYRHIDPSQVKTVLLLGPMHCAYVQNACQITKAKICETPIGNIDIDVELAEELYNSGEFDWMSRSGDEEEHSTEMHMPFIRKVMEGQQFKMVHVMVGHLNMTRQSQYGEIFARFLDRPDVLIVISSDFCHWGKRFRYQPHEESYGEVFQYIEALDRRGMDLIEKQDTAGFKAYLDETQNTICGRMPIGVLLFALKHAKSTFQVKFTHYAQSSQVRTAKDSSVSYASAIVVPT